MALIPCPECGNQISSFAETCPKCGLPKSYFLADSLSSVQVSTTIKQSPKNEQKKKARHKLPNGYGCIKKLYGSRANPYVAYPPTKEYRNNGTPKYKDAIGYFKTYNMAYTALVKWHEEGCPNKKKELTFEEVRNLWFEEYIQNAPTTTINSRKYSFVHFKSLDKMYYKDIVAKDYQNILDSINSGYSVIKNAKSVLSMINKYAIRNGITEKNYTQYLTIKKEDDTEKGIPFSAGDLKIMWENRDNFAIAILLILAYTGLRLNELRVVEIDLDNRIMVGGLKTKLSRNRTIPIIEEIVPLFIHVERFRNSKDNKIRKEINDILKELGIYNVQNTVHTPHDCRHTFNWLCDKYRVEEVTKYMVMGHALGKDVDKNTYTHRTIEELKGEMKKVKVIV